MNFDLIKMFSFFILKKLAIYGWDKNKININTTFDQLTHFEIHNTHFDNLTFLKSANLATVFLNDNLSIESKEKKEKSNLDLSQSLSIECFGADQICSKLIASKLKHLNIRFPLEISFFRYLIENSLFNELDQLDVHVTDWETMIFIIDNYLSLKKLNVFVGESFYHFLSIANRRMLDNLAIDLRDVLDLHIWGIKCDKSVNPSFILKFLNSVKSYVTVNRSELILDATSSLRLQNFKDQFHLLAEFFKSIRKIDFDDRYFDGDVYSRMSNVDAGNYSYLNSEDKDGQFNDFKRFLAIFSNLSQLYLSISAEIIDLDNRLVDLLPIHCKQLFSLTFECWNSINFDFLFAMTCLKKLSIRLRYAINQATFLNVIKNLKYLAYFEVLFEKSDAMDKEELSTFKQQVQECLENELKFKDAILKIELHREGALAIVRYVFKRTNLASDSNVINTNSLVSLDCDHAKLKRHFLAIKIYKGYFRNEDV